jgi:hypothetical protein
MLVQKDASAIDDVADVLFRSIADSDVAALDEVFDDDILVWHSGDIQDSTKAEALSLIVGFIDMTTTRHYEILDRQRFDGGFVQQHILHATGIEGDSLAMRVCIVVKLAASGLIRRIDEYFDHTDVVALLKRSSTTEAT